MMAGLAEASGRIAGVVPHLTARWSERLGDGAVCSIIVRRKLPAAPNIAEST